MRISDFRQESNGSSIHLSARIEWEDSGCAAETLRFEVEGAAPDEVAPAPEAFAIRGALAAQAAGERRVLVEGPLCPRLRDGLRAVLRTLKYWYRSHGPDVALEASRGFRALRPPPPRAALFLSGGVDSLFVLRSNRRSFPAGHPSSFQTAIFVPNFGARLEAVSSPRATDVLARQRRAVSSIARAAGLRLVSSWPSSTELGEEPAFTARSSHGARLAANAHLFPGLASVSIAPSYDALYHRPWGSHPLLDPNYGSSALEVRHEGFGYTRLERVAEIAKWREGLPFLLVCAQGPLEGGRANCGRCEKCVRTMIELLLSDSLSEEGPFGAADLDVSLIQPRFLDPLSTGHWEPFAPALRAKGRADLAAAAEITLRNARRKLDWLDDRGWKGGLRRIDRRILGGRLLRASRAIRGVRVSNGRDLS